MQTKHSTISLVNQTTEQPVETHEITEYINNFFTNIGPDLARNFDQNWEDDIPNTENCSLNEITFEEKEIIQVVKEMGINHQRLVICQQGYSKIHLNIFLNN